MLALPAAPTPAARRQIFVGTALACVAAAMLMGGMLALWMSMRTDSIATTQSWMPKGVTVPEVATNVMLIAFLPICIFGQWAVYSARRDDRAHTGLALFLVALLALAVINAQAFVYARMEVPARSGAFNTMFYALTGTFMILMIIGLVFSVVTAFRYLGGRTTDREIVSAHAMYWYFLSAVFVALWLVVYVTK
jgi:heme/copper-type cytochrome/quinol oxidase subunit 3